jgi:site-specific recombinase XerD
VDLEDAADEYLGWLKVEANKSPGTVKAFTYELRRFVGFLEDTGHSLQLEALSQKDLRAFQLHLAIVPAQGKRGRRLSAGSRSRALVAVRSCLRWLAKEGLIDRDLWSRITVPKVPERLPKPIDPYELPRLLAGLSKTGLEGRRRSPTDAEVGLRDRALVHFLISTGCRISEALALNRTDIPPEGDRLVVRGKGSKERSVYLTVDAQAAVADYLNARCDFSPALWINFDRSAADDRHRRLTSAGANGVIRRLSAKLGIRSFTSAHVARHTTATNLLEATGGDVRLVQEVLGHANLNSLAGYTKIIDSRKVDAYRLLQTHLDEQKRLIVPL